MNDGVSRRNFVALAGAGTAVAACGGGPGPISRASTPRVVPSTVLTEDKLSRLSDSRRHLNPHSNRDDNVDRFVPQFIAIVHLKRSGSDFTSVHGHFEIPNWQDSQSNNPHVRLALAESIMNEKLANNYHLFSENSKYLPIMKSDGTYAEQENFYKFGFNAQHEIFFFIHDNTISLRNNNVIVFKDELHFGQKASANESFFGAKVTNLQTNLKNEGKMIRLRNYLTKLDGARLVSIFNADPPIIYAIGIVYIPSTNQPTIIDPDMGNGDGNEP